MYIADPRDSGARKVLGAGYPHYLAGFDGGTKPSETGFEVFIAVLGFFSLLFAVAAIFSNPLWAMITWGLLAILLGISPILSYLEVASNLKRRLRFNSCIHQGTIMEIDPILLEACKRQADIACIEHSKIGATRLGDYFANLKYLDDYVAFYNHPDTTKVKEVELFQVFNEECAAIIEDIKRQLEEEAEAKAKAEGERIKRHNYEIEARLEFRRKALQGD